jgi:hypothetical protein
MPIINIPQIFQTFPIRTKSKLQTCENSDAETDSKSNY